MATEAETETKQNDVPVEDPKKEVVEDEKVKPKEEKKEAVKEEKKKAPPKEPAPPKPSFHIHKTDFEKDIIYLYQFTRTPLLPSLSPFCLKTETWIRANELKYENVDHKIRHRSTKGLLPFIELNGEEINDSANIIKELGKRNSKDMDAALTPEQRTLSHTTVSMIENHLYWVLFWWRSKYPNRFLKGSQLNVQTAIGSKMPKSILDLLFKLRFRQGQKRVRAQGLGVHTPEEIEELGKNDIKVLSELLGEKEFFFGGSTPTLLDIVAFSVLAQFIYYDGSDFAIHSWLDENATNLKSHAERIKDKYYPDWKEMCESLDLNSHLPKPPPKEKEEKKEKEDKKEKEKEKEKDENKESETEPKEEAKEEPKAADGAGDAPDPAPPAPAEKEE